MKNASQNLTQLTSRENLYRLSLIRGVVLLGQFLALIYFSQIYPIGLSVASISVVLAIYATICIAILRRSILDVAISDLEFFIPFNGRYCFFLNSSVSQWWCV